MHAEMYLEVVAVRVCTNADAVCIVLIRRVCGDDRLFQEI